MEQTTTNLDVTYEAPAIRTVGRVEDLAQGERRGAFLDADFPVGTPFAELTFS